MPRGSSFGNAGEYFQHIVAVRLRINGTGNLKMKFYSLDDVRTYDLGSLAMSNTPGREPDRICNVSYEQRSFLEIKTTEINEIFKINRIIFFTKPQAMQIPG